MVRAGHGNRAGSPDYSSGLVAGGFTDAFTTAAKTRDRSGAQLLRDFMRDFVRTQEQAAAHEAWFRSAVQAGLKAADAGDTVAAEDGKAEARAWRQSIRRAMTLRHHT